MTKKTALWLNIVVGIIWIGIGLRDMFAPGLFSFSSTVASNSTIVFDFAAGAVFIFCALYFRQSKPTVQ